MPPQALEHQTPVDITLPIRNTDRTVGTLLGYEVTRAVTAAPACPTTPSASHFTGSAGQSFGAFLPRGITLTLEGDANDYVGKGLSGGQLIVSGRRARRRFVAEDERHHRQRGALRRHQRARRYVRGVAGERFAVRNSGAEAVVEGVGDHGCEYMTGGRVVVLGRTGRNFAAGMSGGLAYVLDEDGTFQRRCNPDMVDLDRLDDDEEAGRVHELIARHAVLTGSAVAARVLGDWAHDAAARSSS